MSFSSIYLDAFLAVARAKSFSLAAKQLYLTQSALSQRVKNLEQELGLGLFVRASTGILLTEQGERLLRYCQTRDSLEEELLSDLNLSGADGCSGTIKIASYSSVLRSVLIPSLAPLLQKRHNIFCEFICDKMSALPLRLQSAEVDFIVTDARIERANLNALVLGQENLVVVESRKHPTPHDVFLDNDANDRYTENFLKAQKGKIPKYRRSYFNDCYGIIEGAREGLGRAVMSEHLVKSDPQIQIVKGFRPIRVDIVLQYYQQPFYSKLHQAVVEELQKNAPRFL